MKIYYPIFETNKLLILLHQNGYFILEIVLGFVSFAAKKNKIHGNRRILTHAFTFSNYNFCNE